MPLILGTNSIKDTGFNVAQSAMLYSNAHYAGSYSSGNTRTFTYSFWTKRTHPGLGSNHNYFISHYQDANNRLSLLFDRSTEKLTIYAESGGSSLMTLITDRAFRDFSAWYHIVLAFDTTQGTASNRVKVYINGVQETSFSTETYPNEDVEIPLNTNIYIGTYNTSNNFYHGYLAEIVFIDGSALDQTSFGEFDSDTPTAWKPKDVSGLTFGTNGFYFNFATRATDPIDASGNSNNFSSSNVLATDHSIDTCTNNFAILNNLHIRDDWFLEDGGLKFENESTVHRMTNSTIAALTGKWYAEVKVTTVGGNYSHLGVINPDKFLYNTYLGNTGRGFAYSSEGLKVSGNSGSSYGNSFTSGDIIGIAMDLDNSKLYFSKNGTFQNSGDPTSGSTGTGSAFNLVSNEYYSFGLSSLDTSTDPVYEWNFGSPLFSISSGNTDGNGFGNFEYAVPSGYFALCTKNLAEFG